MKPWDGKLVSPGGWGGVQEEFEEDRRMKLENGGHRGHRGEYMDPSDEFGPQHYGGGGPHTSPFQEGPHTPLGFSPEHMMHKNPEGGPGGAVNKKSTSRRNAWGNLSYADLITQAILSSPEKRLTLSQVYDWMVQNIPYFKDKGDSNSSAGWKVGNSRGFGLYL